MKKFLTALFIGVLSSASFVSTNSANAAAGDSIALYFSAPFVQGSHLSGSGVNTETFNGMPAGTCESLSVIGTITGTCLVEDTGLDDTPDASPKIGGGLSNYVWNSNGTTYTFTNPVKYVGLWWFSGNSGNTIRFYDESNALIATMNSSDIISFLGTPGYGSLTNSDTGTLTRADGQTVLRKHYYRFPGEYTGTAEAPVTNYNVDTYKNEPWAYLNLFVSGAISVKKIVLTGTGFEHDNITTSENEASTLGSMVLVKNVLGTTPSTQNIAWAPTNSTADISGGALTPNSVATVTSPVSGGGAISYSVESAGTSGCTVNSSTGAITATAAGTCVIKATAAAVSGTPSYYAASTYKTFTFTANVAITSVSPSSGSTGGATPITITGTKFASGATVTVGGEPCTSVVVVSATSITCVTPAGTIGAKDVVVTNTDSGTATKGSAFTYATPVVNPAPGLAATGSDSATSALVAVMAIAVGLGAVGIRRKKVRSGEPAKHRA